VRAQRVLWASTGTKDPAYRDVLYVEELIGAQTINTMPPATLDAFRDHGRVHPSLEEDLDAARRTLATLEQLGISLDAVTEKLVDDGVRRFADDFDKLLGALAGKRAALLGARLDHQTLELPQDLAREHEACLESWRREGNARRLWSGDASLWSGADEASWLGWLGIVQAQRERLGELRALGEEIGREGFRHIVLLGMGGSSLGAQMLAQVFGPQRGRAELIVLDSTDPAQIRSVDAAIDPARTLFIVSSKSGTTLEPNLLEAWFFERAKAGLGAAAASRFVAITDPGSALEKLAERRGYRHVAHGVPSIGGRYSVLSDFGLVPAAALGLDIEALLAAAQRMVRSCSGEVPPAANPGVALGAALGLAARAGRDKLTLVLSPGVASFGAWLEQLVAESTGKLGKGLIPVDGEPLGAPETYGDDRLFVHMRLHSGEGRWTIMASLAEAVPTPVLAAALYARFRSREQASFADKLLSAMRHQFGGHVERGSG
jgi:transaldolase/glucose-6-phosphate isomerase